VPDTGDPTELGVAEPGGVADRDGAADRLGLGLCDGVGELVGVGDSDVEGGEVLVLTTGPTVPAGTGTGRTR
jgi:hypothetical protein